MKKTNQKSIDAYVAKFQQLLTMMQGKKLQGELIYDRQAKELLKKCTYQNKNGLSGLSIRALKTVDILSNDRKNGYEVNAKNITVKTLERAAIFLRDVSKQSREKTRHEKKESKQDVAQPQLFTESVMREQEQPIVTASDQLRLRIDALEEKQGLHLRAVATTMADEHVKLANLQNEYHKLRNGIIAYIEATKAALNELLKTL